jgi:hypothetical protein
MAGTVMPLSSASITISSRFVSLFWTAFAFKVAFSTNVSLFSTISNLPTMSLYATTSYS